MKGVFFHSIVLVFFLFAGVTNAGAQQATTVSIRADKSKILIGEPVTLTLEATIPANEPIRFFVLDTFPHFEFLNKKKTDTTDKKGGTFLRQVIQVTSFDSGRWVIPSLALTEGIQTDSIPIDVVFSDFDPNQPYHDIKDIEDIEPEAVEQDSWWYIAAAAVVLLLALMYMLTRRKRKQPVQQPMLSPYEEAIEELKKIRINKPEHKRYYSALGDIFRVYLWRRMSIGSLQQTTAELLPQLRQTALSKQEQEQIGQALLLGDFVKFARYNPLAEEDEQSFEAVLETIERLESRRLAEEARQQQEMQKKESR